MKCPKCNSTHSRVIDSRHADEANAIRRRRECENCGTRFTTFEHIEMSPLIVVKKDGTREQFSRCLLYTSPSPRDRQKSRMPSSA